MSVLSAPSAGLEAVPAVHVRPAKGTTRAVVLVLHGGKAVSRAPSRRRHLSRLRLVPFARMLHRRLTARGAAVWMVRYRVRGWNGSQASPVPDARWALDEVRRQHGDVPVVLVGHSMGARTALRVCDDPSVWGAVALAPWCPEGEPVESVAASRVLMVHGTRDRWVSPAGSLDYALRARAAGSRLRRVELARVGHFMLRRRSVWAALTTAATATLLDEAVGQSARGLGANVSTRDVSQVRLPA